MAYKLSGTILLIGPIQTIQARTGTPLTKQDVVITVRKFDQYTGEPTDDVGNTPRLTFVGDKCQQLQGFKPGDIVTIYFDIQGRQFTKDGVNGYFTDIRPFRIDRTATGYGGQIPNPSPQIAAAPQPVNPLVDSSGHQDKDPLPF